MPKLAERRSWGQWVDDGAKDTAQRAGDRVEALLSSAAPVCGLPQDRAAAVDDFVADICKKHSVNPETILT